MNYLNRIILIVVLLSFVACSNSANQKHDSTENVNQGRENCDVKKQFDEYRNNMKHKNISQVSKIFSFPYSSDIWQIVSFNSEEDFFLNQSFNKPDLIKYFDKIFTKEFNMCLDKVNMDELFEKGESMTDEFKIKEDESFWMLSTFDNSIKELVLVLNYNFYEDGDKYESTVSYSYSLEKCDFKIKEVLLIN